MSSRQPLRRLRLRSFKAFERLDVRFGQVTVLAGTNSAGKSTVMHAVAAAHQSRVAGVDGLLLNGPLVELGTYEDIVFDQLRRDARQVQQLQLGFNSKLHRFAPASNDADLLPLDSGAAIDTPWRRLAYVRADRLSPALLHLRTSLAVEEGSLGARGEYAVHQLLRHRDDPVAPHLRVDKSRPATVEAQAEAWIERVSPGTRLDVEDLRQAGVASLRFGRQAGVGFISGRTHRATNVGFGLAYVLPIVVSCLLSQPGDLLMIENPEAHLHPRAQTAMTDLCLSTAAGGVQLVMETHSDHVLNAVRLRIARGGLTSSQLAILFFHRPAGTAAPTVSQLEVDSSGQLTLWPEGFFDEYFQALVELSSHV